MNPKLQISRQKTLTNRRISGMLLSTKAKAVKRRVSGQIGHREPGQVRTGTEGTAEHGLGAAHRSPLGQGCDGRTRYSARLSMSHFSSAADEALAARHG